MNCGAACYCSKTKPIPTSMLDREKEIWGLKWVLLLLPDHWLIVQLLGLCVPPSTWRLKSGLSWWPFVEKVLVALHSGPIKSSLFSPSPTYLSALITFFTLAPGHLTCRGETGSSAHIMFSPNIFSLWKPSIFPQGIRILKVNARKTFFLCFSPVTSHPGGNEQGAIT